MLYLYAIADSPTPPRVVGQRDAPVRAVGEAGLFAVVSEHDELRLEATEDDLWAHERVVETLMESASVLPVRLGTTLADDAAVLAFLHERRHELEGALVRVRGAVELGIRAAIAGHRGDGDDAPPEDPVEAPGPGTAYLRARLSRERRSNEAAARIHEPLASLARASTMRLSAQDRPLLRAAYLVDRGRLEDFMARVEELETDHDGPLVCTGPWPPYSFSSAEAPR